MYVKNNLEHLMIQRINNKCGPIQLVHVQKFVTSTKISHLLEECIELPLLKKLKIKMNKENKMAIATMLVENCPEEVREFIEITKSPEKKKLKNVFKRIRQKLLNEKSIFAHLFSEKVVNIDKVLLKLTQD
ncbi:hypothetical protein [Neobacillus soli]|uniref:hypothetical protein n=1 Tax=Neobacillus soli TaxID=220688 RepID=UPI001155E817|nr:hypothetical protein [Neobacillus soli]